MKIKELKNPITDWDTIMNIKKGRLKIDCSFIIIHFNTGTAYLQSILVEGNYHTDIYSIIESVAYLFDRYSIEDVLQYGEHWEEQFLPINGGEYYIDNISHIEYL